MQVPYPPHAFVAILVIPKFRYQLAALNLLTRLDQHFTDMPIERYYFFSVRPNTMVDRYCRPPTIIRYCIQYRTVRRRQYCLADWTFDVDALMN